MEKFLNITAADAVVNLTCDEIYPAGIRLENFAADAIANADDITQGDARMGVDGGLAAGFVPSIKSITLTLEANSPSTKALQQIYMAQEANRKLYQCSLKIELPSTGQLHLFTGGVMMGGQPFAAPQKVLAPTSWRFVFSTYDVITL